VFVSVDDYCSKFTKLHSHLEDAWIISPLTLLLSSGNGRGGGDYYTDDSRGYDHLVGSWAGDSISVVRHNQRVANLYPDYAMLDVMFTEDEQATAKLHYIVRGVNSAEELIAQVATKSNQVSMYF
jgi:hypothetical protein